MTVKLGYQNVSLRKNKSGSSLLSNDRNSSSLDLVRPLEFHCIHLKFLIIDDVVLVPARQGRGRDICCQEDGLADLQSPGFLGDTGSPCIVVNKQVQNDYTERVNASRRT